MAENAPPSSSSSLPPPPQASAAAPGQQGYPGENAGAPGQNNSGQTNPAHMPPPPLPPVIIPQNTNPIPTAITSPMSGNGGVMSPGSAGGFVRRAAPEPNKRALYVGGLDPRVTEEVLKQIFETTGHVQNVKIIPDKNVGAVSIHFSTVICPILALAFFHLTDPHHVFSPLHGTNLLPTASSSRAVPMLAPARLLSHSPSFRFLAIFCDLSLARRRSPTRLQLSRRC